MNTPSQRAESIAGLRELADFLEACPELPLPLYGREILIHAALDIGADNDAAERAAVDAAAQALGVVPVLSPRSGHYEAVRAFTGGWRYRVLHIPAETMRQHDDEVSYKANIRAAREGGQP